MSTSMSELLKQLNESGELDALLAKSITQATGLVAYNLEGPSKKLFPVLTPLRNELPRVGGNVGGTALNWKVVTGINTGNMSIGIAEGQRGAVITTTTADKTAAFRGIGLEDDVTFEADYAGRGFEDVKATAVINLLSSLMIGEERMLLGGNASIALGTTPTPTCVANGTGTVTAATYSVICVALSFEAWRNTNVNDLVTGIPLPYTKTNADGTTNSVNGGCAQKSAAASIVVGSTGGVAASVTHVNGAIAYAWFFGAASSEKLVAVTTINSVQISAVAGGSNQAAASNFTADKSTNTLLCDGLLTQVTATGSGGVIITQANGVSGTGTPLTGDGAGGIVEFDTMFQTMWDNSRLGPDTIWLAATQLVKVSKIVIANGGAPLLRLTASVTDAIANGGAIQAGAVVGTYLNKITGVAVRLRVHPDMPAGHIFFTSKTLPYSLSGVSNVAQVVTRREYYQLEWALRTRRYEYGVYADELLQVYFPGAFGIIRNVGN